MNYRSLILLLSVICELAWSEQFTVVYSQTCVTHVRAEERQRDWCSQSMAEAVTFNVGPRGDIVETPVDANNRPLAGKLAARPSRYQVVSSAPEFTDALGRTYQVVNAADESGTSVQIRLEAGNAATVIVYPTYSIIYDRLR